MNKQQGPFRVKNIGSTGDVYIVVRMIDEVKNSYEELCPNKIYLHRSNAHRRCKKLNDGWLAEHELEA